MNSASIAAFAPAAVLLGSSLVLGGCQSSNSPQRAPKTMESRAPVGAAFDPGPLVLAEHTFERSVLPNGLRALAVRDDSDPTVSVFVVYGVGSGVEGAATTGLAHLVEHAMYAGTAAMPAGGHDARVQELGGESNAYTRQDYTLYYDHQVPSDALAEVLALEADRMRGLTFDRDAVLHERYRLEVEERDAYSADQARHELVESVVFRNHPYGAGVRAEKLTQGPRLSVEQVRAFYDAWYHPNRASVVVVGDLDPRAALGLVESAFGSLPAGPAGPAQPVEPEAGRGGEARFASDLTSERVVHAWVLPADEGQARTELGLLASVLEAQIDAPDFGASMGGRFGPELFTLNATGADADERLSSTLTQLEELLDADALARAKQSALAEIAGLGLRTRPYFSLASVVGVQAAFGREDDLAGHAAALADIAPASVLASAERWLDPERRWAVRFLPGAERSSELPDDPSELRALAERADASGDLKTAIAAYEKLLEAGANRMNTVIYLYTLGDMRQRSGDIPGAIADLERALEVVDYPAVRELRDELLGRMEAGGDEKGDGVEPEVAAPAQTEVSAAQPTSSGPPSGRSVTWEQELDPALAEEALLLMGWIEEWRDLPFLSDLHIDVVAPEDAGEKLKGWYEPSTDRLVVVDDDSGAFARGTLLHEMVHALQDQHFDLEALHERAESEDAERALSALIEGEAMFAVSELMDYDFERHATIPETGELDEDRFQKVFHYGAGLRYVRALRDAGEWAQVDHAWSSPPATTSAIYHPDRALGAGANAVLEPATFLPEGHRLIESTARGEYGLALWLARDERSRPQAFALAGRLAADVELKHADAAGAESADWVLRFHDDLARERMARVLAELEVPFAQRDEALVLALEPGRDR